MADFGLYTGAANTMTQLPTPTPIPEDIDAEQRKKWSLDLCQNAIFTAALRPEEHFPEPGGPGSDGFEPGFFELRSTHPIRAVEMPNPEGAEVCRYHYGKITIGANGDARPLFCSLSFSQQDSFQRTTALIPFVQVEPDSNGQIEHGSTGLLGAYHAPWWTEAIFHTKPRVCGLPI